MQITHWYDYITINVYYLGLSTISQTLAPLVLPFLIQDFVGETRQGTYLGIIRLWGLMLALLMQALMGMLSDRSTLRWGRRRPFILGGTLVNLIIIVAIGISGGMEGMGGFWFLFAMYLLLQVSSNAGHAAQQGLIPDLVPKDRRGRFSGVKALFEVPLPGVIVALGIARMIDNDNLWGGLLLAMGVLTLTMLLAMLVREKPLQTTPPPLDWGPFVRLLLMTVLFTGIIIGLGGAVKLVGALVEGIESTTALLVIMGLSGLAAMAAAVGLGVWFSVRVGIGAAQNNRSFTWWVINRLAFLVGVVNLSTFIVYFLQARLGFEEEQASGPAATLGMFVGVALLIFALFSGWLADKYGRKKLIATGGVVSAVGTLIVILSPNLSFVYIGGLIIGAGTGLFYSANWALGIDLVPKAQAARYLGLSNLAGAGAGAVGAFIGGPIADYITVQAPDSPGLGYALLFAIYGTLFLLSTLPLTQVQEPGKAPEQCLKFNATK